MKWGALAKLGGQTVSWAITLVVFRLLDPEDYGLLAIGMVLVSVVAGIAEFGLGASLIQSPSLDKEELRQVAGALAALNVACAIVIIAGAPLFAQMLGNDPRLADVIRVLSIQFLLNALDAVPQSLAARDMQFKFVAGIELVSTVTGSVITLVLAWLDFGVWSLIFGNLAGGVLRTTLYVTLGTYVRPALPWRGIGRHVRFGGAVTATRALWQLTYQSDMLVAGRFLMPEAVGLYSISMHLATLPMNKVMGIVNQVAFPAVARLQDELPRMRERLLSSLRLLAFVAIPALWGISAAAPEFVDVILGERWHPAILPLQIVSFIAPLRLLAAVLATALAALGRADLELRNTIVSAIVLPIAFVIGVQHGLTALAASWLVGIPIVFVINFPLTWRTVGIRFRELAFAMRAPLLAGVVMYGCVYGARLPLMGIDEVARLPVLIVAGAIGYLGTLFLLDRTILHDVKRLAVAVRG